MKESIRAAREEEAHSRLLSLARKSATRQQIADLDAVRSVRQPPEVATTEEKRIAVDILEAAGNAAEASQSSQRGKKQNKEDKGE